MRHLIVAICVVFIAKSADAQLYSQGATVSSVTNGSNNVGVGTSTPESKFHVRDGNGGEQIKITRGTGSVRFVQDMNTDNLYLFNSTATNPYMYWGANGNVGIGTYQPDYKLHIKDGNGGAQLKFQRGTGVATIAQDNNVSDLYIDAPAGLILNYNGGNVGIGITNPDHRLHIKDGVGGDQLKFQRGTGVARITQDNNVSDLYIDAPAGLMLNYGGGNVGIGGYASEYKLLIKDGNGGAQLKFQRGTGIAAIAQDNNKNDLYIDAPEGLMLNYGGGNVGIGILNPDQKLTVDGTVRCEEVKVELVAGSGPDYVFEKNYDLLSLSELETYISKNKHLPEVPSAKEMESEGLNLKEMNLLLLKKVEELTLHLIVQNKKMEVQNDRINGQDKLIQELKASLKK